MVLLNGTDASHAAQSTQLKEALNAAGVDDTYSEKQFWTSDEGLIRTVKFHTTEKALSIQAQREQDTAAHVAALDAKNKPAKKQAAKIKPQTDEK